MQIMDVVLAFPSLILGLALVALMGATLTNIVIAIAFTAIPAFARIARAGVMAQRDREYVQACRAMGFSKSRILFRHILPAILPEIMVMASLWMATAVRTEASLAFIGLGLAPPTPTWGGMVREGFDNKHARHHGRARKVALKVRLVDTDLLYTDDSFAGYELNNAVYEKERIAMRQKLLNRQ